MVEWLVEMNRLPSALMLDRMIEDGTVDRADVEPAAVMLARFYERALRSSALRSVDTPRPVKSMAWLSGSDATSRASMAVNTGSNGSNTRFNRSEEPRAPP